MINWLMIRFLGLGVTFMDPRTCGELALVPVTRPFRSQQLASSWDRPHGSAAKYRFHKPQGKHGQTGCPTGSISSIPHMQKDNGVKILQCASCICDLRSRAHALMVRTGTLCSLSSNIEPNASLRSVVGPTWANLQQNESIQAADGFLP